jgi:multimeric flavodoxin WrbA
MKKVVAIIGSPRGKDSITSGLTVNFLELVKEHYDDFRYEIITLDAGKNLGYCRGCMACTKTGECIIKDDLQGIQDAVKKCDFLILGSPVYVHSVSSQFKAFVDRTFVWLHTMRLMGKPSLSVVTTAGSGSGPTKKNIRMILYLLGSIPVGSIAGNRFLNKDFATREYCKRKYGKLAKRVAGIVSGKIMLKPNIFNHYYFWAMKSKSKYAKDELPFEHRYWIETGLSKMSCRKAFQRF